MFRFGYFVAVAMVTSQVVAPAVGAVVDLAEGQFYRPSRMEVSGIVGATTTYTRSPCPALNSMANHGYIPRDGKNLSRALIKAAIMKTFNMEDMLANTMSSQAPDGVFSLADLSKHNLIEHDVSFSRADSYLGGEPSLTTPAYMKELLALSKPTLTLEKTAWLRARRIAECETKNPNCTYGSSQQLTANFQSALLLRVLGGKNTEEISYENVEAFFEKETFPSTYVKPTPAVKLTDIFTTINTVTAVNTTGLSFDIGEVQSGGGSGNETPHPHC